MNLRQFKKLSIMKIKQLKVAVTSIKYNGLDLY